MLVSATAGYLRNKLGFVWRLRSLRAKTGLLALIFALVPLFLYAEFRKAYQDSQDLLLQSVRDQGRVISQSLLPLLENAAIAELPQLGLQLERFAGKVTTIKLLLAPAGAAGDRFYYVASWPGVAGNNLDAERQLLAGQGVLDRLAQSCRGELPFSLLYDRPTGGAEIVTAVTPLLTAAGCWAVVASFSAEAFPGAHLGQPYWATPTIQIAAAIYLAMVVITFSTLLGINGGLRRFARLARQIREHGRTTGSFVARNEIPELAEVAAEFDRMVEALHGSAAAIRRAAEDNAHAFKTPIAVIRQSLEPLRRAVGVENQRVVRAIERVDHSLDRLDGQGVPPAQLDQIFERYFSARRKGAQHDAGPGSFGIGLSIARRNVEAMRGMIEAENRIPQGLIIHIRLPVAPRFA